MHDCTWGDVLRYYNRTESVWRKRYPGRYLLVHVPTLKMALGDPAKDITGGYTDAFLKLRGAFGELYGEYFAVLIPNFDKSDGS